MAKKNAKGSGTIRKKTVTRNGKQYTYWEARITTGRDPGTGKQIQRSFTGKTQKEVRQKMQAAAVEVNAGTYIAPKKMTVGGWLDIWAVEYLGGVKPNTAATYRNNIRLHIKPALGAVSLSDLRPHNIQQFINSLNMSPASVQLIYMVLHQSLEKAVKLEYITKNPADGCELPRMEHREVKPLSDEEVAALLEAAKNNPIEPVIKVALFTGMRQSEILGLTWDAIDFGSGTISVNKQLVRISYRTEGNPFTSPKSGKSRTITAAASVMNALRMQKRRQAEAQLKAGPLWSNPFGLVFTTESGEPLSQAFVFRNFQKILQAAGLENVHFHGCRHTFAVNSLRAGDDVKTVQGNLGHSTAAFTLDKYAHVTERMKQDSAKRMEGFIKGVLNL